MKSITWTALAAILALGGCAAPTAPETGRAAPELVLQGVGFKFFRGSQLTTVGMARAASFRTDTGDASAEKTRTVFLRAGEQEAVLLAGQMAGNVHTRQADAKGGVRILDAEGTVATTARAHLDGETHRASGSAPVEVTGKSFRSQASGFSLDLVGSRTLVFEGPVASQLDDLRGMP